METQDIHDCCSRTKVLHSKVARPANHYGVKSNVTADRANLCTSIIDLEDLAKIVDSSGAACFCRCMKSGKFPLCDGSHNSHNELTGDNAGPVVVLKSGVSCFLRPGTIHSHLHIIF